MNITKKQAELFVAWYKERYGDINDVIEHTSMDLLGIEEEKDILDWKDFLKSILKKDYNKKIKHKRGYQLNGELIFNALYSNYGPKGM